MLKPPCRKPVLRHKDEFRRNLRAWFSREGRDDPWRRTRDPYHILVAEVMLQQTRVATVLERGFYTRFLQTFPSVAELAASGDAELLKAWEGLGYYRRARMLRATAQAVIENHGGVFPDSVEELLRLPGVGRYTAGALRAFAFRLPSVLVDGNVVRVLARLMDVRGDVHGPAGMRQMWEWAAGLADDSHPAEYHAALMELGQTHCRPRGPGCAECPVSEFCATRDPGEVPVARPRTKPEQVEETAVWWKDGQGRVLLHHEAGSRRTGLWKIPLRTGAGVEKWPELFRMNYTITRYRVSLRLVDGGLARVGQVEEPGDEWVHLSGISGLAMAAPFRRAVSRLLKDL